MSPGKIESIHGSSDSGNMSGGEGMGSPEGLTQSDYSDVKQAVQNSIRAGSKRTPAEIEEAIMRKKLRNRESAQRARDRQKARMRWLEEEVTRITGKNDQMLKENLLLRQVLGEQGQKIQELLRREEERSRRADEKEAREESRISIKTEQEEEAPPTPKKPALWRPGLDLEPTPKKTRPPVADRPIVTGSTDDHLSKMRLNILGDHVSNPISASSSSSFSGIGYEQSPRISVPSMPYFPLGTSGLGSSGLSHSFQPGSLSNDSLLLAQRLRQSQVLTGEQ